MIINKIEIENYLCYYGINEFEFSKGLNIILGENNEGKTKFFEALQWLLIGNNKNLESLVSAKKIDEACFDDEFVVSVSMTVAAIGNINKVKRAFTVKKGFDNNFTTSNYLCEGRVEDNNGRRSVDGESLLNSIFPFEIREHYSMFSGEEALNIFRRENALINLINFFSDAKHYNKYSNKGAFLRDKAEKAVGDSTRLNQKNQREYNLLESEILQLLREQEKYKVYYNSTEQEIVKLEKNIKEVKKYVANAEALEVINKKITILNEEISNQERRIDENYTTYLFDENWILVNFEPFHKEFAEKIAVHSKKHRELEKQFEKQKGIKEGEKKAKAELLNNAVPLPIGVPSKAHMEEMLNDNICKVCGRPANPNGSKDEIRAYNFMLSKLKSYLESQDMEEIGHKEEESLFKFDYTNRLENLSLSHEDNLKKLRVIKTKIKDCFEFNEARKKDLEELKNKLENEKSEQEKILGKSNVAADRLFDNLKNYNSWQDRLIDKNKEISDYESILSEIENSINLKKTQKDKIDTNNANKFLLKTRDILRDIEIVFNQTKEQKFNEFIEKLETKSNQILSKINVEAFTGQIKFIKRKNIGNEFKIEVTLYEEGGRYFKPGNSVETSKNIAILLAISELANEVRNEVYPLILDAPISSFGKTKASDFLNLIYDTSIQKIVLLKDYINSERAKDGSIIDIYINDEFKKVKRDKAIWVKLERPFDKNNLKTISTKVIKL